ncbi:MAG TPA: hypothetical protein VGS62_06885 [Streptosporangiaceae bacterium]|nr:hypothetical protein [Streptosporangiaceae bacterium]
MTIPLIPLVAKAVEPVTTIPGYLAEHGDDLIQVRLIDLLSTVARLEQADREQKIEHDASAAERLITCDLPRLRGYLPIEALAELEADGPLTDVPMVCTKCRTPVLRASGGWYHVSQEGSRLCGQAGPVKAMVAAGNENVPRSTLED